MNHNSNIANYEFYKPIFRGINHLSDFIIKSNYINVFVDTRTISSLWTTIIHV